MDYYAKVIKLDDKTTKSKNRALKEAFKSPHDYFFLIEENCKVNDKVFDIFIDTSKKTGIQALMWSGGGPNRNLGFQEDPNIEYFSDFTPAFTMFTRKAVETVGLFDEEMPENTWQMEEYFKRIGDNELACPFGMAPSPRGLGGLLEITHKIEFKNLDKMEEALRYWQSKEGEEFPIDIKERPKQKIVEMI